MANLVATYVGGSPVKPVILGPLVAKLPAGTQVASASVQVERTAGSGAVGSYDLEYSLSGKAFLKDQTINSATIVDSLKNGLYYQVRLTAAPDPGTTVQVTLYVPDGQ
jgi:hypothetical protein